MKVFHNSSYHITLSNPRPSVKLKHKDSTVYSVSNRGVRVGIARYDSDNNLQAIDLREDVKDRWSISTKIPANLTEHLEFFNVQLDEWLDYCEKHGRATSCTEYLDDNWIDAIIVSSSITNEWLEDSLICRKFDKRTGLQAPV